eukprot:GCRY01002593.1.p2 GENE.GCRY01002593.1~~GCRY01002593.1.p2  ORF type:complete len:387 (-),score=38.28 GCRY01002593.1:1476-2636(-)
MENENSEKVTVTCVFPLINEEKEIIASKDSPSKELFEEIAQKLNCVVDDVSIIYEDNKLNLNEEIVHFKGSDKNVLYVLKASPTYPRNEFPPPEGGGPSKKHIEDMTINWDGSIPEMKLPDDQPNAFEFQENLSELMDLIVRFGDLISTKGEVGGIEEIEDLEFDEVFLKQLTDMGFSETASKNALLRNRMNCMHASYWLVEHLNDPILEQPLTPQERNRIMREISRFLPNQDILKHLLDMGFEEKSCIQALRATNNNEEAAVNYLLGERSVDTQGSQEMLVNFDRNHPIVRAAFHNSVIFEAVKNPRIISQLTKLLDQPSQIDINEAAKDIEVMNVFQELCNIFAEHCKHTIVAHHKKDAEAILEETECECEDTFESFSFESKIL